MEAVLYVGHGSRVPEARHETITFLQAVKKRVDVSLQEICFLELAEPSMEQGVVSLVSSGATKIAVIPVLLLSAGHDLHDIPERLQKIKKRYPQITFFYGRPLGVQDRLVHVLKERLEEKYKSSQGEVNILLVGRGSSHPQTKVDLERIAHKLKQLVRDQRVDVCYLAAQKPSFEKALKRLVESSQSQILVIPYLWFTGFLTRHIEKTVEQFDPGRKQVVICAPLGKHPNVQQALTERVDELLSVVKGGG